MLDKVSNRDLTVLLLLSISLLGLMGCSTLPHVETRYDVHGRYDIVYMTMAQVDSTCRKLGTTHNDHGQIIHDSDYIPACYSYKDNIIFTSDIDYIKHEYCHRINPPIYDGNKYVYLVNCENVK